MTYILLVILSVTLSYFIFALISGVSKSKSPTGVFVFSGKNKQTKTIPASDVNITLRKENDGIHIIFPANIEEDNEDIFPDLVNTTPPDDKGINQKACYDLARLPEVKDPDERERIVRPFVEAGLISEEYVSRLAMISPSPEEVDQDEPEESTIPARPSPEEIGSQASTVEGDHHPAPQSQEEPVVEPIPAPVEQPEPSGNEGEYEFNI